MKIDIVTLFPKMFKGPFEESILRRAQDKLLVEINIHNLRKWAKDKHKTVDARPYGGGKGMILMVQPISDAITSLKCKIQNEELKTKIKNSKLTKCKEKVILLDPKGKVFNQAKAKQLSKLNHLILICGHYEGVDARVDKLVNEKISIGEYVLTGGELPAMVVSEAVMRLIPGLLEKEATQNESFSEKMKTEYPQYTRPENYRGLKVPKVLLTGNHAKIARWHQDHLK